MTAHVLYRFYDAHGHLLYVGITQNPPSRFRSHEETKTWWELVADIKLETFASRLELAVAERAAITAEVPFYNVTHNAKRYERSDIPAEDGASRTRRIMTFSLAEVARELRLYEHMKDPVRWLSSQIKSGRVPALKVGRSWRMTRAGIDAALEAWASPAPKAVTTPAAPIGTITSLSQRRRSS